MTIRTVAVACLLGGGIGFAGAEIVYSGYDHSFSYAGFGDIHDAANQDRITDNVWITRSTSQGIFNIAQESSYQGTGSSGPSPIGTMWAFGTTADYDTLSYTTWASLHQASPPSLVNQAVVVYLEDDDIYIDLMFTSWSTGGGGGGFSYVRSNVPTPASGALLGLGGLIATRRRR
ncbi:MAG: hypothetical protein KC996_10380 [Phycisphaerales bacterium]|nr:hypothetical protein [Phycisphaerales bacterium]